MDTQVHVTQVLGMGMFLNIDNEEGWAEVTVRSPEFKIDYEWLAVSLAVFGVEPMDPDECEPELNDDGGLVIHCAFINGMEPDETRVLEEVA